MNESEVESFFSTFYDDDGTLRLPTSEAERQRLANGLIGFVGVRSLEQAFSRVRDKLRNRRPERPSGRPDSDAAVRDLALREVLGTLSEGQRRAVLELVTDEFDLLMFRFLGSLDEFPFGLLSIDVTLKATLKDGDNETDDDIDDRPPDVTILPHQSELHSQWVSWSREFSSVYKVDGGELWNVDAWADETGDSDSTPA